MQLERLILAARSVRVATGSKIKSSRVKSETRKEKRRRDGTGRDRTSNRYFASEASRREGTKRNRKRNPLARRSSRLANKRAK